MCSEERDQEGYPEAQELKRNKMRADRREREPATPEDNGEHRRSCEEKGHIGPGWMRLLIFKKRAR